MSKSISVSLMHDIKQKYSGERYLEKGFVTQTVKLNHFHDLMDVVMGLRYPRPNHSKGECYGLVATSFRAERSNSSAFALDNPIFKSRAVYPRNGQWQDDAVSFFYADIDNKQPSRKVQLDEVADRLRDQFGWNFFIYTTFSHTEGLHKFRVFIETDRVMTRCETNKIAIYVNKELFRSQADHSVYSPAAFIYAPPHAPETRYDLSGSAMDVDDLLRKAEALLLAEPHRRFQVSKTDPKRDQKKLEKQLSKASFSPKVRDLSVRGHISIFNPDVFAPEWVEDYRYAHSHWLAMRSILGRVWRMTDADLTYGEMEKLLHELDATEGGYLANKYGATGVHDLVSWYFTLPASSANDNWQAILDRESLGLTIIVVEAECGAGKTFSEFRRMIADRGFYVYSVPKISDIAERRKEFEAMAGGVFDVLEVHGQASLKRVSEQLSLLHRDLGRMQNRRPTVVFTTHAATLAYDWKAWGDFDLTYDEMPESFTTISLKASKHPDIIKNHIKTKKALDGQCYRVMATAEGRRALKYRDFDDHDAANQGVLEEVGKRNTRTWIKKDEWDNIGQREAFTFFNLFTPKNLTAFRSVRVLADEAMKSTTLRIWAEKWGVDLQTADFVGRARTYPTAGRVSIKYFSEGRDASIDVLEKNSSLLPDIFAQIDAAHPAGGVLWTANAKMKAGINMPNHTSITPKAHGRNDLQNHTVVAWMAALKPSRASADLLKGICGMTYSEFVRWREYNAMYQFVMRCNLRDYGSNTPVIIYVFSRAQAEYLQGRLGGQIECIGGALSPKYPDIAPKAPPLTESERSKIKSWSDKMVALVVTDFERLSHTKPWKAVPSKLIPLINQSASDKMAAKSQGVGQSGQSESISQSVYPTEPCQIIPFPKTH